MSLYKFLSVIILNILVISEIFSQISPKDSLKIEALYDSIQKFKMVEGDKAFYWISEYKKYTSNLKLVKKNIDIEFERCSVYKFKYNMSELKNVIRNIEKELVLNNEILTLEDKLYFKTQIDYEKIYYLLNTNRLYEAKKLLSNMLVEIDTIKNRNSDYYTKNFYANYEIANIYLKINNFHKSQQHMRLALDAALLNPQKSSSRLILIYNYLGNLNAKIKSLDKTKFYFDKVTFLIDSINSIKKDRLPNPNTNNFYLSAANTFIELNQYDVAESYLNKLPKTSLSDVLKANVFHKLGIINFKKGNTTSAFKYLNSAQSIYKQYNIEKSITLLNLDFSKFYLIQNNPKKALASTQSALTALSQTFNSTNWQDNPAIQDVFSKKDLLETLDFKASLLLDMAKNNPQYLEGAYKTALLAAGLIDTIRADYTSDFDKQYLAEWSYGVYEKAVETAFQLYQKTQNTAYLNTAFNALERSKAIVLLEALRTGQAESALSDDDRNKLYQYKSELQKLETQIYDETTKNKKTPDDPSVRSLQNRLFDTRRLYEALVHGFETRYPDYYRMKFGQNFAQLQDIQAILPKDKSSVAIEYFVGEHAIYSFLISKTDCQIFKSDKPKDFDARIETLRHAITLNDSVSKKQFINQAAWLYDLILKSPLNSSFITHNSSLLKKLIIIPDGILNYVPFEMLFDGKDIPPSVFGSIKYSKLPFLIQKYTISYAYSGNLLLTQNQKRQTSTPSLFAGFAAHYKPQESNLLASRAALTRDNAYDLPYAQKEVALIHDLLGGSLYTKERSGEGFFKQNASDYRILHFAMHAVPDSVNPVLSKLLFTYNASDTLEDNDLTASEIYAMRLNADLAVLSACQTGYGKINRGEGVMSLSRAFAYSGVNATVMSLWKVADWATQEIMVEFYKNLKKEQSKDEALHNAKLSYLNNHPENDLKNPYYWAGFVAAGNMDTVDMTDGTTRRWWAFGVLAFIVSGVLGLKSFKRVSPS